MLTALASEVSYRLFPWSVCADVKDDLVLIKVVRSLGGVHRFLLLALVVAYS